MRLARQRLLYPVVVNTLRDIYRDKKFNEKMIDVLLSVMSSGENGVSTREVSNQCDLTIYAARNWLMRLERDGVVSRMPRTRQTTWLWAC